MNTDYDTLLINERPGILHFGGARMALLDVESGFWALRRQIETLIGVRLTDHVLQQAGANGGASFARAFAGAGQAEDGVQSLRECIAAYQAAGFGRFQLIESEWPLGRVRIRAQDTFEAWTVRRHKERSGAPVCAYSAGVLVGFVNVLAGRQDVVCIERTCQAQDAEACLFELLPAADAADAHVVAFAPDPALGKQLNLLELLFDRMPMGIAVLDSEYRMRRYNPTWQDFAARYAPPSAPPLAPGVPYFGCLPGTESTVAPLFERVLAGETIRQESVRLDWQGSATYWDLALVPIVEDEEATGILYVTIDATERVQSRRELEKTLEALRHSQAHLRSLLENARNFAVYRLAVAPSDPYGARVILISPSAREILGLSDPDRFASWFSRIHPADRPRVVAANQQAMETGVPYSETVRWYHPQRKEWIWVQIALTPDLGDEGRVTHFNGLVLDVTEQKRAQKALQEAYQTLEQRVEERTGELATLLQVSHDVNSTLELQLLLDLILDQLKAVVDYAGASILILDGEDLVVQAYRGPIPTDKARHLRFPLDEALVNRQVIRDREPLIVTDIMGDTPLARTFRQTAGDELESTFGYVRSWLGVPLMVKGEMLGMLTMDHDRPSFFTAYHADLVLAFANQVSVAIENARLHEAEQERQRELQTLLDVAATAGSSLDLDEMLTQTLDCLMDLVGASRVGVMLLNDRSGQLEPRMLRPAAVTAPQDLERMTRVCREVVARGEPRYVSVDETRGQLEPGALLPLRVRGRALGVLVIIGPKGERFSPRQLVLFQSIADQLGVAVENAHLYGHAEQAAAAAERSRLARDLHDAVTQTLFSSSLIAEVLPRLWERDPEEGRRRLQELRELTRGALAEMRTLLLELRPSALEEARLSDLLRQLAESITGRARVPVTLEVEGERDLEVEVKIALYRIAQEALNNVAKHAGATRARVRFQCRPGQVELDICDDGLGFVSGSVAPNSLGLGIMRERAQGIGAELTVASQPGAGTQVGVVWRSPV